MLGLLFHYCIAFIWTFLFFVIYPKVKMSPRHKILAGLGYGMLIWVVMNLVVLPLSMTPKLPFQMSQFLFEIAFLMFLIGLPISLIYHKHYSRLLLHQ